MSENVPLLLGLTAQIVAAQVGNNRIGGDDVPRLIETVYRAVSRVGREAASMPEAKPQIQPVVPVKRSVFQDRIICLEDGKSFRTLKRHLMLVYGLTPQAYRAKWGLPADYPMVAPEYTVRRAAIARRIRLGHKDDTPDAVAASVQPLRKDADVITVTHARAAAQAPGLRRRQGSSAAVASK
jgi:predicted transcriptional regulator